VVIDVPQAPAALPAPNERAGLAHEILTFRAALARLELVAFNVAPSLKPDPAVELAELLSTIQSEAGMMIGVLRVPAGHPDADRVWDAGMRGIRVALDRLATVARS
jgi:hypothetical protein